MLRPVIHIDEEKCDGCGQCIMDCAEGALTIVDGKAKLVSETYCDGLGACLNCPRGALSLQMREVLEFNEAAALAAKASRTCAGGKPALLKPLGKFVSAAENGAEIPAELDTWPIQLELLSPGIKWLKNAHLLLAAQCAGFAMDGLKEKWLPGKVLMIACPKLEDNGNLLEKLANIFKEAEPSSITILRMSVPCCGGLERLVSEATRLSGKKIPVDSHIVKLPKT